MTINQLIPRRPEKRQSADRPSGFGSASASASASTWSWASASIFRRWRWTRARIAGIVIAMTFMALSRPQMVYADDSQCDLPPKILVLRGLFEVFSLGMNDLARKLRCRGYDVKLTSWALAPLEAKCCDRQPLVIVGHSLGGRMCGWVPRSLKKCGKRVPLVILVDANLVQRIPNNVDKCVHLFVTNEIGLFHGSPVRGESAGMNIVNRNVSCGQPSWMHGGVSHFNIDSTDWVHDIIINEIAKTFPAPGHSAFARLMPVPKTALDPDTRRRSSLAKAPTRASAFLDLRPSSLHVERFERNAAAEAEVAVVAWRPTRPESNQRPIRERGESPRADAGTDQPLTRPPRIRLPQHTLDS